ncbi:MAG: hypothetical protein DYG89_06510 [Caldilinea sp. CFX5]|nr:hypothetical protein [Caldilinea sp. CFX5]
MITVTNLTCEYHTNPLGIDVPAPRLARQLQSDQRGARQTAYRLRAASDPTLLQAGRADYWDTGKVVSAQSIQLPYEGKPVTARQRVYWQVTIWDEQGNTAASEPAWFEMGLLRRADWKAKWIGASLTGGPRTTVPAPYMRKAFILGDGWAAGHVGLGARQNKERKGEHNSLFLVDFFTLLINTTTILLFNSMPVQFSQRTGAYQF